MERTWMPTVGGILSIVAGGLSLLGSLLGTAILSAYIYSSYSVQNVPGAAVWILFVPYFMICVLAIVGGAFALRRRIWGLALAGSIAALLTVWLWPLGIAAIVFISISKHEFNHIIAPLPPPTPPPLPPAAPGPS